MIDPGGWLRTRTSHGWHMRSARLLSVLGVALMLLASCRDATQITLMVSTNLPCTAGSDWQGVAVYVGKPGTDVESVAPTLVTSRCDESGTVGSVVVVPSGEKDGEVGLRVVAGVKRHPEECKRYDYEGCIVARRAVRFNPHDTLELDVELTEDCVSVGCDPERTCLTGGCVVSRTVEVPHEEVVVSGPSVRCGDAGVRCPTSGNVCCLTVDTDAGTTSGDCRPARDCPSTNIVLNCDDDTDCPGRNPDGGQAGICSLSYTPETGYLPTKVALSDCRYSLTSSVGRDGDGLALCQERKACSDARFACEASSGAPNTLPGYFWCRLSFP